MESRSHLASLKKQNGQCNCAQAVVTTYADLAGIGNDTAMNACNAFAAGMGNMEGTCGALVGAGFVLGLVKRDKVQAMKHMRHIMTQFQQEAGATQCRLLKGIDTGKPLLACPQCVAKACQLLEQHLDFDIC